ncbi:MAG: HAD family phosphatase [Planctomycetota bacterium]|nr:MAG: HAD family phosphatase [Planctomycetota bacterium]
MPAVSLDVAIARRPEVARPRFLYFDLGNVLLNFDHQLAARQMAEVAGVSSQRVWDVVFGGDLELRYESGEIDNAGFYQIFCEQTDSQPDIDQLLLAGSAIFEPNTSIFPLVGGLAAAGYRMGILSNTCPGHWSYSTAQYSIVRRGFEVYALSYELGACKPAPQIYQRAAELAGEAPGDIFFVDDVAGHVEGARAAGFDAVQYTNTAALAANLHERGLEFNY